MSFFSAGIIGSREAQPVQEISSRQFGDETTEENSVKAAGGLFGVDSAPPKTPGPPIVLPGSPPTTDTSMITGISNLAFKIC